MNNLDNFEKKLNIKKERLLNELKTFANENPHQKGDFHAKKEIISPDEDDESIQRTIDETSNATEHSLEDQLGMVNRALERIKQGSYGKCSNCSESIPENRLEVIPEAELCLSCGK